MYLVHPENVVQAVDGASGDVIWEYAYSFPPESRTLAGPTRNIAIYGDKLFLATYDAAIVALEAHSGKQIWRTVKTDWESGFTHTSGPIIAGGVVVSGLNGCERFKREGCFVNLPATRFVIEADPDQELPMETFAQMARSDVFKRGFRHAGSWDPEASLDRLLFILLATAVADLRRLKDFFPGKISPERLRQQFDVQERSQIVGSAAFLQGYTGRYRIPSGAMRLSEHLLAVEKPHLTELYAASIAGNPWETENPGTCARCGKACTWRPAMDIPGNCPPESQWRYGRPENTVPLCHKCIGILGWLEQPELREELAAILWQKRFAAFQRWHLATTLI